jgi:drug/metabolite transporter (DMT)-like permease
MKRRQMKEKKKTIIADLSLLLVAFFWGGGFVAVKDAIESITPFYMIAVRFAVSSVILSVIFWKRLIKITKSDLKIGIVVGIFLFLAFATQTVGAQFTTAGKQAFLTGVNVIIVPFLSWGLYKNAPDIYSIIASGLALAGIGLLTLKGGHGVNLGDILTLACAFFFAVHIIYLGYYAKKVDTIILSITQMGVASIIAFICAIIFEKYPKDLPRDAYSSMFYIIVVSTMLAFLLQTAAQKYTTATHASIILCLEAVFGSILAVIFLGDLFTMNMIMGCVLIFMGIITGETKLIFLKLNENTSEG